MCSAINQHLYIMDALKATQRLIDSVWTLTYKIIDGKVEILEHNRTDPEGYEKEGELPNFNLLEGNDREVYGVLIRDKHDNFEWLTEHTDAAD